MVSVFFSYSHRDESLRDELEVHLSVLKRDGTIDTWHDRRIGAGEEFAGEIDEYLENSQIVLLLVSPYFLDSDYCYDIEMRRAIERHTEGSARVVPVILHPCDWHHTPFSKLLAVPKDGKPVSKFPNPHDAFLEVAVAVREAASSFSNRSVEPATPSTAVIHSEADRVGEHVRSSNLRIRKEFTESERDRFVEESFEYIARFFEGSLTELENRNAEVEGRFRRVDANSFTASIYRSGSLVAECQISLGGFPGQRNQIVYSNDTSRRTNSFNESLTAADDGHSMFLRSMGLISFGQRDEAQLSQQGAAELFWSILLQRLQ